MGLSCANDNATLASQLERRPWYTHRCSLRPMTTALRGVSVPGGRSCPVSRLRLSFGVTISTCASARAATVWPGSRRRIENDFRANFPRGLSGQNLGTGFSSCRRTNLRVANGGPVLGVCPGRMMCWRGNNDDGILPILCNKDERNTACSGDRVDSADVTAGFHQVVPHLAAEVVIADPPEHRPRPRQGVQRSTPDWLPYLPAR